MMPDWLIDTLVFTTMLCFAHGIGFALGLYPANVAAYGVIFTGFGYALGSRDMSRSATRNVMR